MLPWEIGIYFLTSTITLVLSYYNIPTRTLQQIVVGILLVLLISLSKVGNLKFKSGKFDIFQFFLLFLSTLFIQLLVVTTGGFYSPFLILIHLYTIGTSFLLNLQSSIVFLVMSLILLSTDIVVNKNMQVLFRDDPWSVVLYIISFIVIIPLAQILTRNYHLKDAVSKMLSEYIKIEERREESILTGLSEIIVVTDRNLKILSVNNATERALGLSDSELIQKPFLQVFPIKDKDGNLASYEGLSIEQALKDKATRIIEGFYLATSKKTHPKRVDIQVRPIFDLEGRINQIVFVISNPETRYIKQAKHSDLEQTQIRRDAMTEDLRKLIQNLNSPDLNLRVELLAHIEDDLITALELEDHSVDTTTTLTDVAYFCKKVVTGKVDFAKIFGVNLEFILPKEESAEYALFSLLDSTNTPKSSLPQSDFAAPIDTKWLDVMLQKLLELSIMLASSYKNGQVQLTTSRTTLSKIEIKISVSYPKLSEIQADELFLPYYGSLGGSTNLKFSSGLEGYIAKKIADGLNTALKIEAAGYPAYTVLILELSRAI